MLSYILSGLSVENRACVLAGFVRALHSNFARIDISTGAGRMSQAGESVGIMDVKKNLRHLYEMLAIGIMDNIFIITIHYHFIYSSSHLPLINMIVPNYIGMIHNMKKMISNIH